MINEKPWIEGAWMNKYNGKYYFQYAAPGAQYRSYCDGVCVSDSRSNSTIRNILIYNRYSKIKESYNFVTLFLVVLPGFEPGLS